MKIFRAYQKTRFFLVVNILGLAVGLAAAIMLILLVINEAGYDRHFAGSDRIVSLNTVMEEGDQVSRWPISVRGAYTEVPARVPGLKAAVQLFDGRGVEVQNGMERLQGLTTYYTDPEFFEVFQMEFVEGSATSALTDPLSLVLTRPRAEAIFGSAEEAMGKTLRIHDVDHVVTAVVEPLPLNTHFSFDILVLIESNSIRTAGGAEFYTYYLIEEGSSVADIRAAIEREYTELLKPWIQGYSSRVYGKTELLTDIYLRSEADWSPGRRNSMRFLWMLSALALVILAFAVTNFINLFAAQGETRMKEIGVRKSYGAGVGDLVRLFFGEVGGLVVVAFALGLVLAWRLTPAFSSLIDKPIDTGQFLNPVFVACTAALLVVTIVLSASYTALYLSRLDPLDILGKRLRFGKSRLTTAVVCFQSVVTIVLMSLIVMMNRQSGYLKDIPVGYDPKGVMIFTSNLILRANHNAVLDELRAIPAIAEASGADHNVGRSGSGENISLYGSTEGVKSTNVYRIVPGLGELMRFEIVEGGFWTQQTPGRSVVLNEAAVRMLELEPPVVGQQVDYHGPATVTGVVRDFFYDDPEGVIQPLTFGPTWNGGTPAMYYVRLHEGADQVAAQAAVQNAMRKFDPDFVLSPRWSEDIYDSLFSEIDNHGQILFAGSILSLILAMLGLLAIHLYSVVRRIKEIGIRRINGASRGEIFALLSRDILRWILLAGVVAVPVAWWLGQKYLFSVANHVPLDWTMLVLPVVIQLVVAFAVTSGISIWTCSRNPVESLKHE